MDTLTVLYSVKKFWEDLNWPTPDSFALHVASDICRFAVIYFDNFTERVVKCEAMKHLGIFKVPLEVLIAISNITFVCQGIQKLIVELADDEILCDNDRLQRVIGNSLQHGNSRVAKLMQISSSKMVPSIRKLMLEGANVVNVDAVVGDRMIIYIDDSLASLKHDLHPKDFTYCKSFLWKTLLDVTSELIQASVKLHRTPIFFSNLRTIFQSLQEMFIVDDRNIDVENLDAKVKQIETQLERHELNTQKLIHQYFKERHQMQQQVSKSPFNPCGVLSINCFFFNNILKLEILNAKNLVPLGGNKKCDSFVKINFVPANVFPTFQNYKTKNTDDTQNTHFPLYDEFFEL